MLSCLQNTKTSLMRATAWLEEVRDSSDANETVAVVWWETTTINCQSTVNCHCTQMMDITHARTHARVCACVYVCVTRSVLEIFWKRDNCDVDVYNCSNTLLLFSYYYLCCKTINYQLIRSFCISSLSNK